MPRKVRDRLTYALCEKRWADAPKRQRDANKVKLTLNTWLVNGRDQYGDSPYKVYFYTTPILTFHADESVTYHTGGYHTATTMERMNRYGPASLFKKSGAWLVAVPGLGAVLYHDGHTCRNRPPILPQYLTTNVLALLNAIRQSGDWTACPMLADALTDAGAPDALTEALRSNSPGHVLRDLTDAVPSTCC